jgi:hypothetical protein
VRLLQHAVERHPDDPGMRRNLQLLRERTERKELTEKK